MESKTPPKYVEITEGSARMHYDAKEAVFYNKVQVLNRDLSIQVIKLFAETIQEERNAKYITKKVKWKDSDSSNMLRSPTEGISVLEALAATGLRSIRYAQEIPHIRTITLNDMSPEATQVALDSIRQNNLSMDRICVRNEDACQLMYSHKATTQNFDVIDLDPYGTASPFLDAAVQAVAGDGGLLCITSTDAPVLAGNYPEVCFAKYGSMPLKAKYKHEMALRILLHSIEASASRYKRYIVPWLSVSVDFYVRVFVRVYESPAEVKNSYLKRIMTYQSTQCGSFINQPIGMRNRAKYDTVPLDNNGLPCILKIGADLTNIEVDNAHRHHGALRVEVTSMCEESGGHWRLGGPFWGAPMHDQAVVDKVLARVLAALEHQRKLAQEPESALSNTRATSTTTTTAETTTSSITDQPCEDAPVHPHRIATAERLSGILTSISEELKDVPFYYSLPDLASTLQCLEPSHTEFKAALANAGYKASGFHHDAKALKTDAPNTAVWDIMRTHYRLHTSSAHYLQHHTVKQAKDNHVASLAERILAKECVVQANFTMPSDDQVVISPKIKVNKFAPNPEPYWGPKRRAGRGPDTTTSSTISNSSGTSLTRRGSHELSGAQRLYRKMQWKFSNLATNMRRWLKFVRF